MFSQQEVYQPLWPQNKEIRAAPASCCVAELTKIPVHPNPVEFGFLIVGRAKRKGSKKTAFAVG
jgi:hypothetical protein